MKNNNLPLPSFTHPEVGQLYNLDFAEAEPVLASLLELPRKTLIKDLELTLKDSITRYENEFQDGVPENFDWNTANFPVYAIFLLEELKAKESLPAILDFLSYEDDQIFDVYLGDILGDLFWQVFYNIEYQDLKLYEPLLINPNAFTFVKSEIPVMVSQSVLHHPEHRPEAIKWYKDVLDYFLTTTNPESETLAGLVVTDLMDIKAVELLPKIEQLFENDLVDYMICGDYESVKSEMYSENGNQKRDLLDYTGKLNYIIKTFGDNNDFSFPNTEVLEEPFYQEPIINEPKTGRNEPCPCGSGKKYKKCCGK